MLPELGLFCLIIAFGLAILQIVVFFTKLANINIMRPVAMGQACFTFSAFMLLAVSFLNDDFSVRYVAQNSNSSLPIYYKFTALWGAHEGSLLLWIVMLNIWCLCVTLFVRGFRLKFTNALLATFAAINVGFLWLMLSTSNPFTRLILEIPLDGADLNPLLQDFAMIIHPPILYMGYVGCTVAFAFAIAALYTKKLDRAWALALRPWVLAAWVFLTLGIALGSWWAYYELGWGGWWFWDPVENASLMPWLTATALLHCLVVASKQERLLLMAVFLAIVTFALSLLGTFLVRSGSIVSVHAFVSDPQRGLFILQFITVTIGGALLFYALQTRKLNLPKTLVVNRITASIFANNILLLVATGSILLGTLYPLIYDAILHQQISVGYPYFNAIFVPIMFICFIAMLSGTIAGKQKIFITLAVSLLLAILFLTIWFGTARINASLGLGLAIAIIASIFRTRNLAMILAHLGVAVSIIGISLTPTYEIEKDLRIRVGEVVKVAQYDVEFTEVNTIEGANYIGHKGDFIIRSANKLLATISPEKRTYLARETTMTETAIYPSLLQDIYIALGQQYDANTWSVRIYYKPFVRWIWLGAILMACGGICAVCTRRKYVSLQPIG